MAWEVILWVIFFIINIALIAANLYQIVCLTDLEADYMNPYDSSSRINAVVIPEMVVHGVWCAFFLVTGHWFMFLLTLPITIYNAMLYSKRRHLIDVTEVFRSIDAEKKYRIVKLAFYLFLFVLVIIRLDVYHLLNTKVLKTEPDTEPDALLVRWFNWFNRSDRSKKPVEPDDVIITS